MNRLPDFWRSNFSRPLDGFDRLFEDFGVLVPRRAEADAAKYGFNPQCEISEDKNSYLMKFDLPGVPKDQIKIDFHENRITVSGERKEEVKSDSNKKHLSEVFYGSFTRSFTFPTSVDAERVDAKYDSGILNISVPKSEVGRSRQINVK